jgi:hypothetical protein
MEKAVFSTNGNRAIGHSDKPQHIPHSSSKSNSKVIIYLNVKCKHLEEYMTLVLKKKF